MKISSTAKYALGVTAAAAMLAGCSGGASTLTPTNSLAGGAQSSSSHPVDTLLIRPGIGNVIPRHDTQPSFMSPDAKKAKSLLYVSDAATDEVTVYAWPKPKKAVGTLTGFDEPQGLCSDTSGNVFIVNTGASQILEYKSGAKTPSATLSDPNYYPVGCSVDPKTGDLGVTNIISTTSGDGNIAIYAKAKGKPKFYSESQVAKYYFDGYDNKGTLWFSGESSLSDSSATFSSLVTTGKGKFDNGPITGGSIEFGGSTQWDGKEMTTADQEAGVIYQLKAFKITGSTPLTGSSDCVQDFIDGSSVVCPNYVYGGSSNVLVYPYPKGGSATTTLLGFSEPTGSAITGTSK